MWLVVLHQLFLPPYLVPTLHTQPETRVHHFTQYIFQVSLRSAKTAVATATTAAIFFVTIPRTSLSKETEY